MKLDKALKIQEEEFKECIKLRISKAKDYASDEDCLQNFKKIATLCKILSIDITRPCGVAMQDALLKIDRLCNLIFRKKIKDPINEPLRDSFRDLKNYLSLAEECLIEETENTII